MTLSPPTVPTGLFDGVSSGVASSHHGPGGRKAEADTPTWDPVPAGGCARESPEVPFGRRAPAPSDWQAAVTWALEALWWGGNFVGLLAEGEGDFEGVQRQEFWWDENRRVHGPSGHTTSLRLHFGGYTPSKMKRILSVLQRMWGYLNDQFKVIKDAGFCLHGVRAAHDRSSNTLHVCDGPSRVGTEDEQAEAILRAVAASAILDAGFATIAWIPWQGLPQPWNASAVLDPGFPSSGLKATATPGNYSSYLRNRAAWMGSCLVDIDSPPPPGDPRPWRHNYRQLSNASGFEWHWCKAHEINVTLEAWNEAWRHVEKAYRFILRLRSYETEQEKKDMWHFGFLHSELDLRRQAPALSTWFGPFDNWKLDRVWKYIHQLARRFQGTVEQDVGIYCWENHKGRSTSSQNWFATPSPKHAIYLRDDFYDGSDTHQVETIMHEMMHFLFPGNHPQDKARLYCGDDPHVVQNCYNRDDALKLLEKDENATLENIDNYVSWMLWHVARWGAGWPPPGGKWVGKWHNDPILDSEWEFLGYA